jgi:hypothetical protein
MSILPRPRRRIIARLPGHDPADDARVPRLCRARVPACPAVPFGLVQPFGRRAAEGWRVGMLPELNWALIATLALAGFGGGYLITGLPGSRAAAVAADGTYGP